MLSEYWLAGTTRSYWVLSTLLMAVYVAAMLAGTHYADAFPSPLRAVAALFPLLPVIGFVWLEFRRIRVTDELRQRMELEAGMLTLALGVPLLLGLGLLDNAGILSMEILLATPLLMGIYVLAQVWTHRRYQ